MRKGLLKKLLGVTLAVTLAAGMASGCGERTQDESQVVKSTQTDKTKETNNENKNQTETKITENSEEGGDVLADSGEETTISFVHWRSEDAEVYKKLISQFEEQNPNIKVEMEVTSADMSQYYALIKARLSGSQGLDVFAIHPGVYLSEYQEAGQLMDLTEQPFVKEYLESMVESCTVDGKVYGLPQAYNNHCVFYNKKIFAKYNLTPPKTWEDMENVCKVLKENGEETIVSGSAEEWVHEIPFIQLIGSYFKDDPLILQKLEQGEVKFTDEKFQAIFKDYQDMGKTGFFTKDAMGTKYEPSLALFAQEKAAMLNTGTWSVGGLKQQNPDLEFGIFLLPSRVGSPVVQLGPAQALTISANTKNSEASLKFLEFLSSKDAATLYANVTMQNSGVKDVKLDMDEMNMISDLIANEGGESVTCYHIIVKNVTLSDLWRQAMVRSFMGEDVSAVTSEIQSEWDASR